MRALSPNRRVVALRREVATTYKIELIRALGGMQPRLAKGLVVHWVSDGDALYISKARQDGPTPSGLATRTLGPALACIVLTGSSLDIAGVAATLSAHLAAAGIGCNILTVSGRDHVFVPDQQGTAALEILEAVSQSAQRAQADAEKRVRWSRWREDRGPV